ALARRSPRYFGMITPVDGSSMRWPARPIRCMPLATDGGDSTWITRSIAPMSMPSSSELVATSAGRRPDLRSSSIRSRCSRAIDPWCACTSSSPASSLSAAARRSASHRVDLVDDHALDRTERVARQAGEDQIERLGGGDEDVRRLALVPGALARRRVAGADRNGGLAVRDAQTLRLPRDADERFAKVAL